MGKTVANLVGVWQVELAIQLPTALGSFIWPHLAMSHWGLGKLIDQSVRWIERSGCTLSNVRHMVPANLAQPEMRCTNKFFLIEPN